MLEIETKTQQKSLNVFNKNKEVFIAFLNIRSIAKKIEKLEVFLNEVKP